MNFYRFLRSAKLRRVPGAAAVLGWTKPGHTPRDVARTICRAADQGKITAHELDHLLARLTELRAIWIAEPEIMATTGDDWVRLPDGGHMRSTHHEGD